ncbi:MAG: efflux RND transporter periplasmic adaptor subunit [Lachnospiraceae bacterium]|nr:efflux RND transporter periplasmic adaptor subunit [Lachnospiraceae bacterium]
MKQDKKMALVCVVTASMVLVACGSEEEGTVVYREAMVEYGDLTVGITEDSKVNIGTIEQTFDLDISALVDSDSSSTQGNTGGAEMDMQMGNGGMMSFSFGSNLFASESQEMVVEQVHITVGQEIAVGDVLYTLSEESVNEIRSQLEADVEDMLAEFETLEVEQQEDSSGAKQSYNTYVVNGKLAPVEYEQTMLELKQAVLDAEEQLLEKQNQYNESLEEITKVQEELAEAKQELKEAEAAVAENYENRFKDSYYYTVFRNTRDMAKTIVESLEEELEQLEEQSTTLFSEIAEASRSWNKACRALASGELEAKQTLETDQYYAEVADEWYSIQREGFDNESMRLYNDYANAVEKLNSFDSYIRGTQVISEYAGVITEVMLSEEDNMTTGTVLVSLYNQDEVTMDISISEADYEAVDRNGKVNVSFTAYPEEVYNAMISEVSDAEYDSSSGELYYTITVTLQGDTSGLYEGMTGEVTFVTKETEAVLYVSNRAIFREGTRSYVKVRDESGNVQEKDVVTGFSDGVNVEIVEGLSEGDVVLIESKVNEA